MQGNTTKKNLLQGKVLLQGKQIEIARQYTYLGFTFVLLGKRYVGIENLIKKGKKNMVFNTKPVKQIKRKTNWHTP